MTIVYLLLCCLSAFLDRLRGDNRGFGGVAEAAVMGLCLVAIASQMAFSWWWLVVAACWSLGASSGWSFIGGILRGDDFAKSGASSEWWQFTEVLKTNLWLAAVVRGLMWALPCAILAFFYQPAEIVAASIVIAFPLSLLFTRSLLDSTPVIYNGTVIAKDIWGKSQLVRGFMCGALVWIGAL